MLLSDAPEVSLEWPFVDDVFLECVCVDDVDGELRNDQQFGCIVSDVSLSNVPS